MFENIKRFFSENKPAPDMLNTDEIGRSGTKKIGGFITEEYNTDLQGLQGVEQYEEMRSSDASVGAVLLAAELPIRATKWRVEPGKTNGETTKQDEEIAEFIKNCLFEWLQEGSFDDFLRQSLTMLPFGFSVFEKVFMIKDGKIILKKLAQRMQHSIYKWENDEGDPGIVQQLFYDDTSENDTVFTPEEYLVTFSFRKEGDNTEGRSILRTSFKHWYIKDSLYKIDAVKHERIGIGIPVITLPKGASDTDKDEAETILENLRGTEQTYIVLPSPDWKIEFMDLKGGATADPSKSIAHHDRQISKSILAQFIDLGSENSGGSYALSEDQSSLFTLGLTAIANQFTQVVDNQVIKELVHYNFNIAENQTLPYLDFAKIGDVDYEKLANAIETLVTGGVLGVDDKLEDHMRDIMDLPERSEDSLRSTNEVKQEEKKEEKKIQKAATKATKATEEFSEDVLKFSEDTKVEARVAKKIISYLEKIAEEEPVRIEDVSDVLRRLKDKLRKQISISKLLSKATDEEIEEVVEDIIKWRTPKNPVYSKLDLESYGYSDKEEFKQFKKAKEVFNFLDVLNIQNDDK